MRLVKLALLGAAVSTLGAAIIAEPASAACTRLGFTVNDYGKDGPTRDAKKLLDKYIGNWTAEKGIKNYKTGPKSVKCELFLDFGFFDEHTCRAEASVCWEGPAVPGMPSAKPETAAAPDDAAAKTVKPKAEAKKAPAAATADVAKPETTKTGVTETGSTSKSEKPAEAPSTPSAQ